MHSSLTLLISVFASVFICISARTCSGGCRVPTLIYDNLKCKPLFAQADDCCPLEYDCSHIYQRPAGTCHIKGKFYKTGESPDAEDTAGNCDHAFCKCSEENVFKCIVPSDSCAEFWVPGFEKPGCYLTYELNRCCSNGQNCESNYETCTANGVTYKEGQQFNHPTQKCTKCVCGKGFDEKSVEPFCSQRNCTTELKFSKQIDDHCAPLYRTLDDCCPNTWICPSTSGTYTSPNPLPPASSPQCQFGEKKILLGEKYTQGTISCECVVPPYLTCASK